MKAAGGRGRVVRAGADDGGDHVLDHMANTKQAARAGGRRERTKRDKQDRIHAAARDLFATQGYSAVTTQQIADRADVAVGTLFRYAASKAELLLMVYNDELRTRLSGAPNGGPPVNDPSERIMALLGPLIALAVQQRENTLTYQREILFGEPAGQHHRDAISLVQQLEQAIADVLVESATSDAVVGRSLVGTDPRLVARCVFSLLHMELIRTGLGRVDPQGLLKLIRSEIDILLRGVLLDERGT